MTGREHLCSRLPFFLPSLPPSLPSRPSLRRIPSSSLAPSLLAGFTAPYSLCAVATRHPSVFKHEGLEFNCCEQVLPRSASALGRIVLRACDAMSGTDVA